MKQDIINIRTEVARVAIIFNKNDYTLQQIIDEIYTVYSGPRFLLFPCDEEYMKEIFMNMLKRFDPDIVLTLGRMEKKLLESLKDINPIKFISEESFSKSFININSIHDNQNFFSSLDYDKLSNVEQILFPKSLYDSIKSKFNSDDKLTDYHSFIDEVYCTDLYLVSGNYNHDNVNYDSTFDKYLLMDKKVDNPRSERFIMRSFFITGYQYFFTEANNIFDLCLYWNVRNYYWDSWHRKRIKVVESKKDFNELIDLIEIVKKPDRLPLYINLFSFSFSDDYLVHLKEEIEKIIPEQYKSLFKVNINPNPPVLFDSYANILESKSDTIFWEGNAAKYLLKSTALDASLSNNTKISSIDINYSAPLPINIQEYKNVLKYNKESKVSLDGIRYLSKNNVFLNLKKLENFELIQDIVANKGYTVTLSDKGSIALNIMNYFENLDDLKYLYNKQIIKILKTENKKIYNFKELEELNLNISEAINQQIILQGFSIKCQSCRKVNWYYSIDYKKQYICNHCYSSIILNAKHETEYKINELFSLAYTEGVLTHLFSLRQILSNKRFHIGNPFYFIPGALINELNREIDFILVDEEGLKIGECKNDSAQLNNQETDSIIHIATELRVNKLFFCSLNGHFSKQIKSKLSEKRIDFIENISSHFS